MPEKHLYLIAHKAPFEDEPLPEATVVATITADDRILRNWCPNTMLLQLANRLGLVDFEISTAEARDMPGHQLGLPFPRHRRRQT
jgi:hypothetical protein